MREYISSNVSATNINSRKALLGSFQTANGIVNVTSTHTHWRTSETDSEQDFQITNVKEMANQNFTSSVIASFVCGDFNVNPTSSFPWSNGYFLMVNNGEYIDAFLEIFPDANNKPPRSKYHTVGGSFPGRIDYVFMDSRSQFEIKNAQIVFTDKVIGNISDHNGVMVKVSN